jgi:hypothetical protein
MQKLCPTRKRTRSIENMSNVGPFSAHRNRKRLKSFLKKNRELSLTFYLTFLSYAFFYFILFFYFIMSYAFFVLRFETLNHKVTKP